jgi:hypothetical protein
MDYTSMLWQFRKITPVEERLAMTSKMRVTIAQLTLLGPPAVVTAATELNRACSAVEDAESVAETEARIREAQTAHTAFVAATLPYMQPELSAGRL